MQCPKTLAVALFVVINTTGRPRSHYKSLNGLPLRQSLLWQVKNMICIKQKMKQILIKL